LDLTKLNALLVAYIDYLQTDGWSATDRSRVVLRLAADDGEAADVNPSIEFHDILASPASADFKRFAERAQHANALSIVRHLALSPSPSEWVGK
jgi:hypothetical protein